MSDLKSGQEYDYPSGHDMDEFDDPLDDAEDSWDVRHTQALKKSRSIQFQHSWAVDSRFHPLPRPPSLF